MVAEFAPRTSVLQVEEGLTLSPRFDAQGLIPVVVTDAADGVVLMLGYMNAEALAATVNTGEAHYFSRSRGALWRKGEVSGLTHTVKQILIDDDQDAIWLRVKVGGSGASCHVGYRSCFYRELVAKKKDSSEISTLNFVEAEKVFDAEATYAGLPNPTKL